MFSGDIGYMDADGYFYIVDRKKDMALIGGFNVYPNNVEKVLKEHPAILEVGVAAIPHPERIGEEALKAWVVLKPGMTITEQELVKHCEANLAGYEVPRRFSFIKELPKTSKSYLKHWSAKPCGGNSSKWKSAISKLNPKTVKSNHGKRRGPVRGSYTNRHIGTSTHR